MKWLRLYNDCVVRVRTDRYPVDLKHAVIVRNIFVGRQPVSDDPLRARLWAVVAIFGALAADQAVKRLLLSGAVDLNGTTLIPGVANVAFAWNRGVSFSLLWQNLSHASSGCGR